MAKKPKSGKGDAFKMPTEEELQALLGNDDDFPDMTPGEMAAASVSTIPPPVLAMMGADEKLAGLMVAIDPELSLAETNLGLEKIEDLLIAMLAEVRNQRRDITHGPGSDNLDARASTIHGKAAIELLEQFLEAGDEDAPFLPGLDPEDMRRNLKTLKARG